MRVIIQRVKKGSVSVNGSKISSIEKGIVLFLGIENNDTITDIEWMCTKVSQLRIFDDENKIMNKSLIDIDGDILIINLMEFKSLQKKVDNWINEHGVRYFDPLTNMAQLTEEVGEVARVISRRFGEQSEKESDKKIDLGEELSDVLFVVLCLANQTGIDLDNSFNKKIELKSKRDHLRHKSNPKLK